MSTGALRSARAASRPPKPAPTITTFGRCFCTYSPLVLGLSVSVIFPAAICQGRSGTVAWNSFCVLSLSGQGDGNPCFMNDIQQKRAGWSWWYLLFIVQFVLALWVPLYNKAEPSF